jgi:hypothetical protein
MFESDDKKPSAFDYATKLLVPILSLVALIVSLLSGNHPRLVWSLMGLTAVAFLIGLYPSLQRISRTWIAVRKDTRTVIRVFPRFKALVHRFAAFVDTRYSDTLHYIAQNELCRGHSEQFDKLGIPNLQLWYSFAQHFMARADQQRPNLGDFAATLEEFYSLVGAYNNYCVAPIFQRLPREFQEALAPD